MTIWVRGNTMVPRSAGFMSRIILAAKRESLLLTRRVIPCDQLKTFMNLGERITRILQTRMFAKLSPNYTVCIPHLLD